MGATSTRTVEISAGATDWRPSTTDLSLYLPVVGRAAGVNDSYFVSDLALLNTDAERPLEVDAVYLPDGRSDSYHRRIVLGGGELLHTRDVLAQLFNANNGIGSVRLDLSHPHAVAVARTYNDQSSGTAGFSTEALPRDKALRDGETGVILQHWLPGYRTNVGFVEVAGVPSEITVTAYDETGSAIGNEVFALGAYDHQQINGRPLFQRRGRIEISVKGGRVLAYASTVDGETGDPIYQTPDRGPGESSLLVPVAARLAGANNTTWRTDLRIFNASSTRQTVTIGIHTGAGVLSTTTDLEAGKTASFDDVISTMFPQLQGNTAGAIRITGSGPLMASSRTFNLTAAGTYGLYVPARAQNELLAAGETAYLVQLQENDAYRCNFGMTALDGPGSVRVSAFDATGLILASKTYDVAAGQNMQVGRVLENMGVALPIDGFRLEVTVLEGTVFVYASVNDNRTGDGTFVEATR
jgi:hypothetical protein